MGKMNDITTDIFKYLLGFFQVLFIFTLSHLIKSRKEIIDTISALKTEVAIAKEKSNSIEKDISDINKKLDKITDILMTNK